MVTILRNAIPQQCELFSAKKLNVSWFMWLLGAHDAGRAGLLLLKRATLY